MSTQDETKVTEDTTETSVATESKVSFDVKELAEVIAETSAKMAEKTAKAEKKFVLTNSAVDSKKLEAKKAIQEELKFIKSVYSNDRNTIEEIVGSRAKALNEGTGADGGYLVPATFEQRIFMTLDDFSEIIKNANVVRMTSNVQKLNEVSTKVTAYKITELGKITGSYPTYSEPVLTTEKYGGSTDMSEELLEDAEVDVLNNLATQFGEQIAYKLQDSLINSVVSNSEGLLQVSGVTAFAMATTGTYANVQYEDLKKMKYTLMAINGYKAEAMNGKYYMNPATWDAYISNTYENTNNLFVNPFEGVPLKVESQDVILLNEIAAPTVTASKFVIYSDLSKHLVIGERRALRMKVNTQGTSYSGVNLNYQDAREMVVTARFAQVTVLENGIVILKTS